MKNVFFLLLYLLLDAKTSPLHQEVSPQRFSQGDGAFRQRRDPVRAREALESYRSAFQKSPLDSEAAWRLAMACQFMALRLISKEEEKLEILIEGKNAGKASVKISPQCAPCHFWTAINMALYGQEAGIFKMVFTLKEIQEHLHSSIQLDPGYAYSGAYRVLGLIEQKLPGILGGSNSRARHYFEQAILHSPDEPMNYFVLARLLDEEFDLTIEAREVAKRGASLAIPSTDRVESVDAWYEVRDQFIKLEKKAQPVEGIRHSG